MTDNYQKLVQNNLKRLYTDLPPDLAVRLPADQEEQTFHSRPLVGGAA